MAEALRRLTTPALAFGWNLGLFSFSYLTANNITSLPQFLTSKMGIILSAIYSCWEDSEVTENKGHSANFVSFLLYMLMEKVYAAFTL